MIRYYLDASAWVKRYVAEPGSRWVDRLIEGGATVVGSPLGAVEVIATLARKERAGEIPALAAERASRHVGSDWGRFVQVNFDETVFAAAMALPRLHALRGADAVHLASAMVARGSLPSAEDSLVMVSSDAELLRAAEAARFPVFDPSGA